MDIQNIIQAIQSQHYRITDHADEEAQADRLRLEEIFGTFQKDAKVVDSLFGETTVLPQRFR